MSGIRISSFRDQKGSSLFFVMCIGMMLLFEISLAWETGTTARMFGSLALLGRVERIREINLLTAAAEIAVSSGADGDGRFEVHLPSGAVFMGILARKERTAEASGMVSGGPVRVWGPLSCGQRKVAVRGVLPKEIRQ